MKYFVTLVGFCLALTVHAQLPQLGGCAVTFNIGNQTEVCSSQNVFVLPSGNPSGGVYGGSGVLDDLFFPSIAGPGEHIITYTYDDGFCVGSAQDTIFVVAPDQIVLAGDFEICSGENTTIVASNATDIEWSTNEMGNEITLAPTTSTIYSVSGYDENFCITSADFEIIVHDLPNVIIGGNTDVCIGEVTELSAIGAVDYVWSTAETSDVIQYAPMASDQICVDGIDANGCAGSDCVIVLLHNDPVITITGETDVCSGTSTTLMAGGGTLYNWSTGSSATVINLQPITSGEICLFGEDQFGCESSACVNIEVLEAPVLSLFGANGVCYGEPGMVYASGADFYSWSNGSNADSTQVVVLNDTILTVIGTLENGCEDMVEWLVEVFPLPDVSIEGPSSVCPGEIASYTGVGAFYFEWPDGSASQTYELLVEEAMTINAVGVAGDGCIANASKEIGILEVPILIIDGASAVCPSVPQTLSVSGADEYVWSNGTTGNSAEYSLDVNTIISVEGTNEIGCSATAELEIEILTGEGVDITGDLIVCPGDTILATIEGLTDPLWDNETTGISTFYALSESGPISVTGINSDGCVMTYSENATINPLPELAIDGDLEICLGETVSLEASGAINYFWSTGDTDATVEFVPSSDIVLLLEGISNLGCSAQITVVVEVHDATPIIFELSQESICDNAGNLALSATPSGGIFSGNGVSGSVFDPAVGMNGSQEISYSYTNDFGCTSQSIQSIVVDDCSGVVEMESISFEMYPNPAEDRLTINSDVQGTYALMIVNAHGQLVRKLSISSPMSVIDIADLSAGMYEMVLMQNGEMITKRFVKG